MFIVYFPGAFKWITFFIVAGYTLAVAVASSDSFWQEKKDQNSLAEKISALSSWLAESPLYKNRNHRYIICAVLALLAIFLGIFVSYHPY